MNEISILFLISIGNPPNHDPILFPTIFRIYPSTIVGNFWFSLIEHGSDILTSDKNF